MTVAEEDEAGSRSDAPLLAAGDPGWPVIPRQAWQRGIGVPSEHVGRPRVAGIIDDGEFAGVPIGGLGTGSIGRTFRGDAARWHLEVGTHRHEPVAADGFSLFIAGPSRSRATVLSALRPAELPDWGWTMPLGGGTYHGLFPRAWQTFEPEATEGIRLVGEQLSPVIPGDLDRSSLPVGVIEWWMENPGTEPVTLGLLFSWADPPGAAGPAPPRPHRVVDAGDAVIVELGDPGDATPTGLRGTVAIAALGEPGVGLSARASFDPVADRGLWTDFAADGRLDPGSPDAPAGSAAHGAAVCATVVLKPREQRSIRFAIAWDLPIVEFGAGRRWWKRYTRRWGRSGHRAVDLARHALVEAPAWRRAIEAWQAPYFADPVRPDWYVTALFNELYFLVDGGSFWEAGEVGAEEPALDGPGRFGLLECVDYPFYDTVDVDFYASFALLELFPELEHRGIRDLLAAIPTDDPELVRILSTGVRAARKRAGAVPHDLGGPADDPFVRPNWYRFQDVNDWKDLGPKFVLQAWRDAVAADGTDQEGARGDGARGLVRDAYPIVEAVLERLGADDHDGDGLPEHDGPDQTYDTWPMRGPSAYGGSLWVAALAAAEAMARRLGDDTGAARWRNRLEKATASFDRRLWRGSHYAYDDGGGPSSDSVMADQLAGQWYADVTGLGDLLPRGRVEAALRTIHRQNVCGFRGGRMGAVNGTRPDGAVDRSSEQSAEVWVGTSYALAAFMIGRGLIEEGWDTARGVIETTYARGLAYRTPEAYDEDGNFRASIYLRPLAIWAIEDALRRHRPPAAPGRLDGGASSA